MTRESVHMTTSSRPIIRTRRTYSQRRKDGLLKYASNRTSQHGEDGIIERIFTMLPHVETRWCVDVGAWDGHHWSNTYNLLCPTSDTNESNPTHCTWKGLLIEANDVKYQSLQSRHAQHITLHAMVSVHPTSTQSLPSLLVSHDVPHTLDFLSLDTDGPDYWILHALLSSQYRPKVLCVEFNPTIPHSILYIPPQSDYLRHGCSLAALVELTQSKEYTLIETTTYNAFFLHNSWVSSIQEDLVSTRIEELHEVSMGTQIYQLYDGSLKLAGCRKLLWHTGKRMQEKHMQVLSESELGFPFAPHPCHSCNPTSIENENENDQVIINAAIDMSPYCVNPTNQDPTLRTHCAMQLVQQLQHTGLVHIKGISSLLSSQLCTQVLQQTFQLLHHAPESLRRTCLSKDRARRGYSPANSENFASLWTPTQTQTPTPQVNDLVRKFRLGCPHTPTTPSSLLQPNLYPQSTPDHQSWTDSHTDTFRSIVTTYYHQIHSIATIILIAICDGLLALLTDDLGISHLRQCLISSPSIDASILTLLAYQHGARHQGSAKTPLMAPHTDVGLLTVLLYAKGNCASLQRLQGDQWETVCLPEVVPNDPILVVNVGDCLSELCRNLLPSPVHRVMPLGIGRTVRCCVGMFLGLAPEQELVFPEDNGKMTFEEWRRRRILRAARSQLV